MKNLNISKKLVTPKTKPIEMPSLFFIEKYFDKKKNKNTEFTLYFKVLLIPEEWISYYGHSQKRYFYSLRKLLTGLARAAFMDWILIVPTATSRAPMPARRKTHHTIEILNTKSFNHRLSPHHAIGKAIKADMRIITINSFERR